MTMIDELNKLNQGIREPERDLSRDEAFKRFFSRRTVLAATIKDSIKEFENMSFPEVVDCLIPSEDNPDFVKKLSEEITEYGNKVLLDIIFECKINSRIESARLIVDLEMQRKYNMDYPIIKRGLYYASELLARQLPESNDYNKLVPVYSIWISRFGVKKALQNTVTRFRIHAENSDGVDVSDLEEMAGLINVDLITLSPDYDWDAADAKQVKFLQSIFNNGYRDKVFNPYVEVTDSMINEIHTIKTKEDEYRHELEVELAQGRAQGREEGRKEGREEGREEGKEEGREEGVLISLAALCKNGYTVDEAFTLLNIPENKRSKYKDEVLKRV